MCLFDNQPLQNTIHWVIYITYSTILASRQPLAAHPHLPEVLGHYYKTAPSRSSSLSLKRRTKNWGRIVPRNMQYFSWIRGKHNLSLIILRVYLHGDIWDGCSSDLGHPMYSGVAWPCGLHSFIYRAGWSEDEFIGLGNDSLSIVLCRVRISSYRNEDYAS